MSTRWRGEPTIEIRRDPALSTIIKTLPGVVDPETMYKGLLEGHIGTIALEAPTALLETPVTYHIITAPCDGTDEDAWVAAGKPVRAA